MNSKLSYLVVIYHVLACIMALDLCIKRISLNSLSQSVTVVYDRPFTSLPQFGYGTVSPILAIQNVTLLTNQANVVGLIVSNASLISCQIMFNINITGGVLNSNQYIDVVMFFISDDNVEINTIMNGSQLTFPYVNQHKYNYQKSYSLTLFTNTLPCMLAVTNKTSVNFTIEIGTTNFVDVVFTYVLVEKIFIATNIFIIFDKINQVAMDYYLQTDQQGYLMASDQNSFQGIMNVLYNGTIRLKRLVRYNTFYEDRHAIKTGFFPSSSNIINVTAGYVNFNPQYTQCPLTSFMSYTLPFSSVPQGCRPCHSTCNTCTSSDQDSTYSDQRFCTTCPSGRQLLIDPIYPYGKCLCMLGTIEDQYGICVPCEFNCLDFNVYFLKSSTSATFLLIFNFPDLTFDMQFLDNLKVYVDTKASKYESKTSRRGVYKITLPSQDLQPCQQACQVSFKFLYPYKILHSGTYLTTQYRNVTIEDFYIVQSRLPKQLTQAFAISSLIISASSSTGQTSLIKMLFQLEQIIDVHKYINLQIPVVFKQFVEALSSFRFLDLTTVISYDINSLLKSFSIDELDCKGSAKIVYYQNGVNFYKNIIAVVFSFLIILTLNFLIYLFLKILPINFTRNIAEKIKIRWLITLSDMLETMALPVALFSFSQLTYIIKKSQLIWVYMISQLFCVGLLLFPFYVVSHCQITLYKYKIKCQNTKQQKKRQIKKQQKQLQRQIAQDLLQDCNVDYKLTYIFYVYNFMRKFLFGIVMAQYKESGFAQGFILLFVNLIQLCMMCYIILNKIFKSKAKIFNRTINLICIIIIQSLIIGYNIGENTLQQKILLGVTCTYLALISTGLGILQLFIKLVDVLCQATLNERKKQKQEQIESVIENVNHNHEFIKNIDNSVVKCKIAVDPLVFNIQDESNSQASSQNKHESEVEYKEDPDTEKNKQLFKKQSIQSRIRRDSIYRTTIYEQSNSQNSQIAIIGSETTMRYQGLIEGIYKRKNKKRIKQIDLEPVPKRNIQKKRKQQTSIIPPRKEIQRRSTINILSQDKQTPNKDTIQFEDFPQFKPEGEERNRVKRQLSKNNNALTIKKKNRKKLSFLEHSSSNSEIASIQQY